MLAKSSRALAQELAKQPLLCTDFLVDEKKKNKKIKEGPTKI